MSPVTHVETFTQLDTLLRELMKTAPPVKTERWQGVVANTDTRELLNVNHEIDLEGIETLDYWRTDCRPNLPWADDHFLERVGGEPLNPGVQWAKWPWGHSANKFRAEGERFNHTYMQRLWPKWAGKFVDGAMEGSSLPRMLPPAGADPRPHYGINHYYGDLWDLVRRGYPCSIQRTRASATVDGRCAAWAINSSSAMDGSTCTTRSAPAISSGIGAMTATSPSG